MRLKTLALAGVLAGCTSVVPSTALKLAMTDPLTADPADIAVAITLPDGLAPQPNSAELVLSSNGAGDDVKINIILAQTSMDKNRYLYAVKAQDVARLRDAQRQILQNKAKGKTTGSFGVTAQFCTLGNGPADDARGSIDVRFQAGGPLLPLYDNAKLDKIIAPEKLRSADKCKGAQ